MTFRISLPAVLALFSGVLFSLPARAQTPLATKPVGAAFSVQQDARFATVARGLASAVGVEVHGVTGAQGFADLRRAAVRGAQVGPRHSAERTFRRMGALGAHTPLRAIRILAYTRDGAMPQQKSVAPSRLVQSRITSRAAGLNFKYIGFTSRQIQEFEAFRDLAYPLMTALYGEPAPSQQGRTVLVQNNADAGDGVYQLPDSSSTTSGGTIFYDPVVADGGTTAAQALAINNYNLSRAMLIAFRGAQILAFDAWERGMADAAALVVNYQAAVARFKANPAANPNPAVFDPSQLGIYLLPVYDILNRPELGNPIFFASGTSPNLGFYRLGMAQAAWLKVWIQNPRFFSAFNAKYYAASAPNLAGNTPALKQIALDAFSAAGLAPQVEGLGFNDWYRRQNVLDTAVTTGEKLWLAVVPQANLTDGDTRSVFFGVAQHYNTAADGSETPIGGTGTVRAENEIGLDVTRLSAELNADSRVVFNALGEAELNGQNVSSDFLPIVGFSDLGTPDRARLTITVRAGLAEANAFFPYNVAGTVSGPNGFYGATIGADAGALSISANGRATTAPIWQRGVFSSPTRYPSGPRVFSSFSYSLANDLAGAGARTIQRNSAWAFFDGRAQSFAAILETNPLNSSVALNPTVAGDNRLRMISLPLTPLQSDEAAALGINAKSLLLARYRPNLSPRGFTVGGLTYGVTADKHELYPNISEPLAPGRGYWLKVGAPVNVTVRGGEPTRARPFQVPLLGGWNQVGVPFNQPFALAAVLVRNGTSAPVSFATAISNGWIGAGVWRWKPNGGYARVDSGAAANQQLQPFEGYYVFSRLARGVKLVFAASSAQTRELLVARSTLDNWRIGLLASTATMQESDATFGASAIVNGKPMRIAAAKAPAATRALTLSFLSSGNRALDATRAGDASGWTDSYIAPFSSAGVWRFLVDGTNSGETVRLAWGDIRRLPVALDMTLIEESSGRRVSMAPTGTSRPGYTFTSDGAVRRFRIEATARPPLLADVRVGSLAGSLTARVTIQLGTAAVVDLDIETLDGETVRTLATNRNLPAGSAHWTWNGRDAQDNALPAGDYIAHLTVRDERGTVIDRKVRLNIS